MYFDYVLPIRVNFTIEMSKNYLNSDKHKQEHSHWDRRGFLKVLGIAGAGSISLANSHLSVINYVSKRPNIHIPNNNLIKLSDDFSIPRHMDSLIPFWKEGKMKVVHGVGYENQNLSHFTSSDIWATGTRNKSDMSTGWIGRFYDEKYFDYTINPPEKPSEPFSLTLLPNSEKVIVSTFESRPS